MTEEQWMHVHLAQILFLEGGDLNSRFWSVHREQMAPSGRVFKQQNVLATQLNYLYVSSFLIRGVMLRASRTVL